MTIKKRDFERKSGVPLLRQKKKAIMGLVDAVEVGLLEKTHIDIEAAAQQHNEDVLESLKQKFEDGVHSLYEVRHHVNAGIDTYKLRTRVENEDLILDFD